MAAVMQLDARPDWVGRLYEILDELVEAPRRLVVEEMMLMIPSGPAHREGAAKARADHNYRMRKLGLDPDPNYEPAGDLVRRGRQRLALKAIQTEVAARRIERFTRGGRMWLRAAGSPDAAVITFRSSAVR
jgi:hypothetical protein